MQTSAVTFATKMRAHVALASADVERSIAFYSELFETEPTKVRRAVVEAGEDAAIESGTAIYAKFELAEPPLNLTLNFAKDAPKQRSPAHFGVQVKSTGEVMTKRATMARAGFAARAEVGVGCCYAVQDKVWFEDPDANAWEVFVVTEADIPEHSRPAVSVEGTAGVGIDVETDEACCSPGCCA